MLLAFIFPTLGLCARSGTYWIWANGSPMEDRWRLEDSVLKGQIIVDFEPWWEEVTDTTSCPQDSAGVISAISLITFTANLCVKTCLFNAFNYQKM